MHNNRISQLLYFLEKEPNDSFLLYALAMEYSHTDLEKSLELYRHLLSKHSEYLPTYYQAAKLYEELEENEQALETYQKGISLSEKLKDTHTLKELQKAYQQFLQNQED
jgi:tetratricopeptide (TPR) repeat protein